MAVKGKVYKSPYAGFRLQTRSEAKIYHPATGVEIQSIPALVSEFGIFGEEFDQELPDGTVHRSASITGGFFDTEEAAERLGWTDEEHETVVADLDRWCQKWPEAVQLVSKVAAGLPWPTYDTIKAEDIAVFAETLGLLVEAIAYESENKNRKTVLSKLNDALEKQAAVPAPEELTVA